MQVETAQHFFKVLQLYIQNSDQVNLLQALAGTHVLGHASAELFCILFRQLYVREIGVFQESISEFRVFILTERVNLERIAWFR